MSREVVLSPDEDLGEVRVNSQKPEDLAYLAQREGLPGRELPAEVKQKAGVENIREVLEADGKDTDGQTPQMKLEHEDPPEEVNPNAGTGDDSDIGESDDDWYGDDDTTKDQLVKELHDRELDVSGRKADLIRRLRADDAEKANT